jgi:DNA adenine methylase
LRKIKSPLRYPGGKSKVVDKIMSFVPNFDEYREPFVGGGSVFIELKQQFMSKNFWINDLNYDLFSFWKQSQYNSVDLATKIMFIKEYCKDGNSLYRKYKGLKNYNEEIAAIRFFILNRITFSGTTDSGGYSAQAFEKRFTNSSIERVSILKNVLKDVKITNLDYHKVIENFGQNVFLYLDPPYLSNKCSKLYGNNGDLHDEFDHIEFANSMKKCKHKWLITYDDCDEVRNLFSFAEIIPWELQYGMNNINKKKTLKGKELFIKNY